jgi:ABC-type glycerol-3-phosphate transport system substrate-binding protein
VQIMTSTRMVVRMSLALATLCAALAAGGCATTGPQPLAAGTLAEAETFPYFRIYWTGPTFAGQPLAAADGQQGYNSSVGDSVYYGDCVHRKGIFGGGNCLLPLQVTTVIYRSHSNAPLGAQRNTLIRGVPATVYDEGRAIELYSGQVAIDIFADTFAHAYLAATQLLPANAPGSARGGLPLPVYCPGLSGQIDAALAHTMDSLPGHACQQAAAITGFSKQLTG